MRGGKQEKKVKERIEVFNAENEPFYIVDHEDGSYSLCLCFLYTDGDYCQEAFDEYAREQGEKACEESGLKRHGSGYEWEAAFRKAFESEREVQTLTFDSESDGFYCYGWELATLEDLGRRFKALCEDTERFTPVVSAGIKEEESRRAEEKRRMQTLRGRMQEALNRNPDAIFEIRLPEREYYVTAKTAQALLSGTMSGITSEDGEELSADQFLGMQITAVQQDLFNEDIIRIKAEPEETEKISPTMKM